MRDHPLEWEDIIDDWFPGRLQNLKERARVSGRPDYDVILARLQEPLEEAS